ncbi:MAG: hypothetical protein C0424_09730 [Sphingobacteriaceae bacterium]|nr:hypothetical protein [Sphingobacteriaceae bacterium]
MSVNSIRIRAFRATDDPASCDRFIEGHAHVLEVAGVKKVTSANHDWKYNPGNFVIIVENENGDRVLGGARLQCSGGNQPLPIEEATGEFDKRIYEVVAQYAQNGTAELCGLWNSREVAGLGIGAFFATRVGVVIAEQIGIESIFALCAPYTVKFAEKVGCRVLKSIGNNGTFYYPKLDLLATIVLLEDAQTITQADPQEQQRIFDIRKNLNQVYTEMSPLRNVEVNIHYNLEIKGVDVNEFKLALQ